MSQPEKIDHPPHYLAIEAACKTCGHKIECIDIAEHFNFNLGNVIKYLWRAEHKGYALEDLKKAAWYLNREIQQWEGAE